MRQAGGRDEAKRSICSLESCGWSLCYGSIWKNAIQRRPTWLSGATVPIAVQASVRMWPFEMGFYESEHKRFPKVRTEDGRCNVTTLDVMNNSITAARWEGSPHLISTVANVTKTVPPSEP